MSDAPTSSGGATSAPTTSAAPAATSAPATSAAPSSPASTGTDAASPPSGQQTPPAAAPWRTKTKVNGKEIDLSDKEIPPWLREAVGEDEAVATYRLRAAAQNTMREAARQRAEADKILSGVKTPEQMMRSLVELYGGDASKIDGAIEAYYQQRVRDAQQSPEQRENARLKAENERMRREHEEHTTRQQQQRQAAMTAKYREQFSAEMPAALKAAGLTEKHTPRLKAAALRALEAGDALDFGALARDVKAELAEEWQALHGEMSETELLELIGEERMQKVRAADVARLKAAQAQVTPAVTSSPRTTDGRFMPKEAAQRPRDLRDFFEKRRG